MAILIRIDVKQQGGEYHEISPSDLAVPYSPPYNGAIKFIYDTGEEVEIEDIGE